MDSQDSPSVKKCFPVKKDDFLRAGEASIQAQGLLKSLSLDGKVVRRIAICGYEGEMNMVMHGGDGTFCLLIFPDKVILELSDQGPGIPDIEKAMQKGFSTASEAHREMGFGAGMGLPNIQKNADELKVISKPGEGTVLHITFVLNAEG